MQIAITKPRIKESRRFLMLIRWIRLQKRKHIISLLSLRAIKDSYSHVSRNTPSPTSIQVAPSKGHTLPLTVTHAWLGAIICMPSFCDWMQIGIVVCNSRLYFKWIYLDMSGNRLDISFKRVWNRLNCWRCEKRWSFVSIAMLIWSFTRPCDLCDSHIKYNQNYQISIFSKLPKIDLPMQMTAFFQIHITPAETTVHWNARPTQQFLALQSCSVVSLDLIKFLFVALKNNQFKLQLKISFAKQCIEIGITFKISRWRCNVCIMYESEVNGIPAILSFISESCNKKFKLEQFN